MHPFDFFVLKKFRQVAHLYSCQQDFLDAMFIYIVYIYIYIFGFRLLRRHVFAISELSIRLNSIYPLVIL